MTVREKGWLSRRLPLVMGEDPTLRSFLGMLEEISESLQLQIDQFPLLIDSSVTPTELLEWLGFFIDTPDTSALPEVKRRQLITDLGASLLRRGTRAHMEHILAAFTDGGYEINEDGGVYREGEAPTNSSKIEVRVGQLRSGTVNSLEQILQSIIPTNCALTLEVDETMTERKA
tara:strand:+ start:5368 stop:5889 length:522 start_codon:yes stop_codon:yes gene_type:complete